MSADNDNGVGEREPCTECGGEGGFHDCGEDVCPCEYHNGEPEDVDWWDCPECKGTGEQ